MFVNGLAVTHYKLNWQPIEDKHADCQMIGELLKGIGGHREPKSSKRLRVEVQMTGGEKPTYVAWEIKVMANASTTDTQG